MNSDELDRMAGWLRDRADRVEEEEPYATTTIEALRTAADYADGEEPDDEDDD